MIALWAFWLAQIIEANVNGNLARIAVGDVPTDTYTQCASYVTGTNLRHLYCTEGEVIYSLSPAEITGAPPLTDCAVEYVDTFRRRLVCYEGSVDFGYVEGFILGTVRYQ